MTDVSKKDQFEALIAAAVREFGRVDIMVNNAGIAMIQDFLDVTKADYDKVLGVNLEGAFWGTQAAARQMIAQGEGGVIINMSSINSGLANPRVATYAITKGGMNQITAPPPSPLRATVSAWLELGPARSIPKWSGANSSLTPQSKRFYPAHRSAGMARQRRSLRL